MLINSMRAATIALSALMTGSVAAQTSPSSSAEFAPFKLIGGWVFTSHNTNRRFQGDIEVDVQTIDAAGVMHGRISYDGRQMNDLCRAQGVSGDDRGDVKITRTADGLQLQFLLKCVSGESPRPRDETYSCSGTTCTRPIILGHGRGASTLEIVR